MYFPILRGRQNELLALRELQEAKRLEHVTPIIEPVKASSTLLSVLQLFQEEEKELLLVGNPIVGSFEKELSQNIEYRRRFESLLMANSHLVGMYYCGYGSDSDVLSIAEMPKAYVLNAENRDQYDSVCQMEVPAYTLVSTGNSRVQRKAKGRRISLESAFKPQARNADYCSHKEDFLTEELFYYTEDGFDGFSDYSVIGEGYSEGGFMPKVVALHLVHLNPAKDQLFVRHFTSSEERRGSDVGGKFHEALGELISWADDNEGLLRPTSALDAMKRIYVEGKFPGLGVAKRLAIMHHLELVNSLLEESR